MLLANETLRPIPLGSGDQTISKYLMIVVMFRNVLEILGRSVTFMSGSRLGLLEGNRYGSYLDLAILGSGF